MFKYSHTGQIQLKLQPIISFQFNSFISKVQSNEGCGSASRQRSYSM